MKIFILLLITATLASCSHDVKKNTEKAKDPFEVYNDAYDKATKSAENIDTIFLGLRFGMPKSEVITHLKRMKRQGKIKTNALEQYEYLFKTREADISATIGARFFEDKLYELELNLETYYINGVPLNSMSPKVLIDKVRGLFLNKYIVNKNDFEKYYYDIGVGKNFCYINQNLVVEFNSIGQMTYTNAPIAAKKENQEKAEKSKSIKSSIADL